MSQRRHLATAMLTAAAAASVACGSPGAPGPAPAGPESPAPLSAPSAPLSTVVNQNWGFVAPNPANPRYLRTGGASGRPFAISSYGTLVGCTFTADQARRLKELGATYAVLWYQWSGCDRDEPSWFEAPWSGPWRIACDPRDPAQRASCPERPTWDLSRFDDAYWQRLLAMVAAADDASDGTNRRMVVRVHLFARQEFGAGRDDNPFRGVNNVNGVRAYDGDPGRDPDLRFFAKAASLCAGPCDEPARSLFAQQQAYVRKLLDVTHAHGNVVYEMMNEPPVADDPESEGARAFAYFTEYWSWFVKDYLASRYGVARIVSQDQQNSAFAIANVDVADARWGTDYWNPSETAFLAQLDDLASAIRTSYLSYAKVTTLDEFGNEAMDPSRLRRELWSIVTSGGNFHLEDPCDPGFRACAGADAQPWTPVRSIEAFKAVSGWRFDRARPVHRDEPSSVRWFYWMLQDGPPFDTVGFPAAGAQDHVGYLAHHSSRACSGEPLPSELPPVPGGASEYVARLWNPAGTDYFRNSQGAALEHRFGWNGGDLDWCETPLRDHISSAEDVVIHVHAGR